ncbi:MAG: TonB-dependent receptor plug domain-containing protein [Gemmatimonadetes bacterium]|nr:TonB-dependent receptor plug domain-containing protein [Gemmatimonadota bacterium]NNM04504.1 TonB-dependent receptor plug domain-containing protein [Gemmatimonadota bacterium]
MKDFPRVVRDALRQLLLAVIVLFPLACATSPSPENNPDIDPEGFELLMGSIAGAHIVEPPNTVRPDDIEGSPVRTFSEMLSRIPGVWVTDQREDGIRVRIRGISSMVGGQEPLFVIDGMIVQFQGRDLDGVDMGSIESITVLKNAGETAYYGSRGANGVIVIRTKKGT